MSKFSPLFLLFSAMAVMAAPAFADDIRDVNTQITRLNGTIQSINGALSEQRAYLGALKSELGSRRDLNAAFQRSMLDELKKVRLQNQALADSLFARSAASGGGDDMIKPIRNYDQQTPDGKMIFGEDEYIYLKEANATFDARIDTGAKVSSVNAQNITAFERKGKQWYRFDIIANDRTLTVEAPFVRTSTIRQSTNEETTERIVVKLNVKLGEYSGPSEFTLGDRSNMQYPVLIGRSLIQDIAVVDIARAHVQGRNEDSLLILSRKAFEEAKAKGINPNAEYEKKQATPPGAVASPAADFGTNLGTNADLALPEVQNMLQQSEKNKSE